MATLVKQIRTHGEARMCNVSQRMIFENTCMYYTHAVSVRRMRPPFVALLLARCFHWFVCSGIISRRLFSDLFKSGLVYVACVGLCFILSYEYR